MLQLHHDGVFRSKKWFIVGGVISLLVGVFAIVAPGIFSFVLAQVIGALCLASGLVSVFQALFGKSAPHRVLCVLSAAIRIAAGSVLLFFPVAGVAALTLILAAVFAIEGMVCAVTAFRMRANPAWFLLLLNGLVALVLAGMIYAKWPLDAAWVIGLLYGIQSAFSGAAMLAMGLSAKPPAQA